MRTVRDGHSVHRYRFGLDQGEVSRDPQRTNETSRDDASENGLSPEVMALLAGKLSAGEIAQLAALVAQARFGASAYEAAASEGDPRAAPTPWVQEDQPPSFPGRPHRSSRATDATFTPLAPARDVRPNGKGRLIMATDTEAIRQIIARGTMKQTAKVTASLEARFPGITKRARVV